MHIKNEALKKLYDKLTSGTFVFSPSGDDPIDEAFKECDEELSDSVTFAQIKTLQDSNEVWERSNSILLDANQELASKKRQLEKDLDDAKKQLNYFTQSRDNWRSRAKHAEEVGDNMRAELEAKVKRMDEITKERDSYRDHYTEIRKAYDERYEENKKLKARADCLHEEVLWYRKHYREQWDKIRELKYRLNSMCGDDYFKGQTDLWKMLQEVSNYYYFGSDDEFDTDDCDMTSMTDIIDVMDVNQFLEAYKNWHKAQEQERIKYMRDYLGRFCTGRKCHNCPLHADEFGCGRGKWFYTMTYKELKKHYEAARDYNRRPWHGDATAEKIKFEPWTCTLEGTLEINGELLGKVCGVKIDGNK